MQIFLIFALIIALLAVIFAIQNVAIVSISFFAWHIQGSLAVVLLVALGAGVLISILVSIPGIVKRGWNSASSKKKFSSLETERDQLKSKVAEISADRDRYLKKVEESEKEIADLEERLASFSAALVEAEEKIKFSTPATATTQETGFPVASMDEPVDQPAGQSAGSPSTEAESDL
jgi:uncharacterized integral membrane protein